ncbi:MAG: succinate-CoA ligase [Benjaminiella poitrasii]|nr:MAG: succinate-CoA ligase [Benjaminiella poitrasii]
MYSTTLRALKPSISPLSRSRYFYSTNYESTLKNLLVTKDTKVLCQGLTGKQATFHVRESIQHNNSPFVAGVSPTKAGQQHLNLPVFRTVQEARKETEADASLIFVPAPSAVDAMMESIEAEIPLIIAVTEGVRQQEMVRVQQALRTQHKSRLVGPGSPGLVRPSQGVRLGVTPAAVVQRGTVGVVSTSPAMMYEAMQQLVDVGLGQSLCVGVGESKLGGTSVVDALQVLLNDRETEGVVVVMEPEEQEEVCAFLNEYNRKSRMKPKPVVSYLAGMYRAEEKRLEAADIIVARSPAKIGSTIHQAMQNQGFI